MVNVGLAPVFSLILILRLEPDLLRLDSVSSPLKCIGGRLMLSLVFLAGGSDVLALELVAGAGGRGLVGAGGGGGGLVGLVTLVLTLPWVLLLSISVSLLRRLACNSALKHDKL